MDVWDTRDGKKGTCPRLRDSPRPPTNQHQRVDRTWASWPQHERRSSSLETWPPRLEVFSLHIPQAIFFPFSPQLARPDSSDIQPGNKPGSWSVSLGGFSVEKGPKRAQAGKKGLPCLISSFRYFLISQEKQRKGCQDFRAVEALAQST